MSDINLTPEEVAAYGADDPTAVNAADPNAATGSLVGTVIDPKDVTPPAETEGTAETAQTETPEETTQDTEAAPTAPETPDPRLEVARLEGELKVLREMYATREQKPVTPVDPLADLGPVGPLAAMPETEAYGKYQGLLEAGKYLDAQVFLTKWQSAQLVAPGLKKMMETQNALAQSAKNQTQESAIRQLQELDAQTKGEYKRYEKEIAALVMADAASRQLGNPPIFKNLKEVFDTCKARAGAAPTTTQPAAGAKKALAKGPGSGTGGVATAQGGPKKALSPEDKVLQEFWDYGPTSL